MEMAETELTATMRPVWNAGRTVGAKRALKPKQIWEIRFYLNQRRRLRDRALFDLAIESKLRCHWRTFIQLAVVATERRREDKGFPPSRRQKRNVASTPKVRGSARTR